MFLPVMTCLLAKCRENLHANFGLLNMWVSNVAFFRTLAPQSTTNLLPFSMPFATRARLGVMVKDFGLRARFLGMTSNVFRFRDKDMIWRFQKQNASITIKNGMKIEATRCLDFDLAFQTSIDY